MLLFCSISIETEDGTVREPTFDEAGDAASLLGLTLDSNEDDGYWNIEVPWANEWTGDCVLHVGTPAGLVRIEWETN